MIDVESEPGSWQRELARLGNHGPKILADERETLLETIRRLHDRIVTLEAANTGMRLCLEGVASCSTCEPCRTAALSRLNSTRR